MTETEFADWVKRSKGGDKIIYATCGTLGDKHLTPETLAVAEKAKKACRPILGNARYFRALSRSTSIGFLK